MQLAISLRSQTSSCGALCRPIMLEAGPAQKQHGATEQAWGRSVAPWWAQLRLGHGPALLMAHEPSGLGLGRSLDRLEHSGDRLFVADATNGLS